MDVWWLVKWFMWSTAMFTSGYILGALLSDNGGFYEDDDYVDDEGSEKRGGEAAQHEPVVAGDSRRHWRQR